MDVRLVVLAGTRPEALKLAPLASTLRSPVAWWWTGQQAAIPLSAAGLPWQRLAAPAHPLRRRQLHDSLRESVAGMLARVQPRAVLVQGDTASAYAGARAACDAGIDVIHLEAGLRSGDLRSPFPEEAYRRVITRIAALHLAPTRLAAAQLRAEGVPEARIMRVGSTAIDGLRDQAKAPASTRHDLLVDIHRRENGGRALGRLAEALGTLASSGLRVSLVTHPNRHWARRWDHALGTRVALRRLPPMERDDWLAEARVARCVLSDSGGAAEELPYLGVPLLVYRRHHERPEAIASGHAQHLCPQAPGALAVRIRALLDTRQWPPAWPFTDDSPYGDGRAGLRAAAAIDAWLAAPAHAPHRDCGVPT